MKLITTTIAALAIVGSLATAATAQERRVTTRTVVTHGMNHGMDRGMHRGRVVKKVIVRRDRGMHRGWENRRHGMVRKKVIIER